jgi:hypothetical protein
MTQQRRNTVIRPIPKKSDRTNCENYRGILLLDVTYKVLAKIVKNRLRGRFQVDLRRSQLVLSW